MAISNNFGLFGSYLSSYSFVFVGVLSYIIGVFIGIQGLKSFLGFKNSFYILRFIANIFGILFVSMFLFNYGAETLNTGLLATFLSELSYQILFSKIQNDYVLYFINLLIFVLGIFLILISFSIKFKLILNIFKSLKNIKVFKIFKLCVSII